MAINPGTVSGLFDTWAEAGRDDRMAEGHWPTARQLLEKLDPQPGQRFLDIGCGNGYTVAWAAQRVGPHGEAYGMDVSPAMVHRAAARVSSEHVNARFFVGDAAALPFADASVDRIVSIEALYYMPNLDAALAEIARVLAPGGRFAAMVDFYVENPYSAVWADLVPVPMAYLSEAEYRDRLSRAGLQNVDSARLFNPAPVDAAGFTAGWGYETVYDVRRFRTEVGSLGVWGERA